MSLRCAAGSCCRYSPRALSIPPRLRLHPIPLLACLDFFSSHLHRRANLFHSPSRTMSSSSSTPVKLSSRAPSFVPILEPSTSLKSYRPPHPPSASDSSPSFPAPLARPVALRLYEPRLDRADPRGTHSHRGDDSGIGGNSQLPRPRRHLRSRSYGDEVRAPKPPAEGPVTLAPEALRGIPSRSFSPSLSTASFGSAVTPDGIPGSSSVSSDNWSEVDEASARAHILSTVASATGTEISSPSPSDLSDHLDRRRPVGKGWARAPPRVLSSVNATAVVSAGSQSQSSSALAIGGSSGKQQLHQQLQQSQLQHTAQNPNQWLSHPNLTRARCTCNMNNSNNLRPGSNWKSVQQRDRGWSGGSTPCRSCSRSDNGLRKGHFDASNTGGLAQSDKKILRYLKKRLTWTRRK